MDSVPAESIRKVQGHYVKPNWLKLISNYLAAEVFYRDKSSVAVKLWRLGQHQNYGIKAFW